MSDLIAWCTHDARSNNTVYQRKTQARTFFAWCHSHGIITHDPAKELRGPSDPLRTYHRTYGKVQTRHPGRWLTHEQAYQQLVDACRDGTEAGLRDELAIRLGLAGMRVSEIAGLTVRNIAHLPTIAWTGKGRKPRKLTAGNLLQQTIAEYLSRYGPTTADTPLVCCLQNGHKRTHLVNWHKSASHWTLRDAIGRRAEWAGLGHVSPHDLRRTAAGILHRATNDDGAHHFDLLDIQKVLGHSDPAVTMRSYLEPMDTDVLDRASSFLD